MLLDRRIIKHPFRVRRCLWKQLHLHWTTLNHCFFLNDCWFALYTFLTHYRRLLVWNEHYSALLVTVHGHRFQQRFYSKFWRSKWGQRNKKGPFLCLNICEYFWPRESFGNSLNAEIKRSRRQQSLIFQWQSQHQSEKPLSKGPVSASTSWESLCFLGSDGDTFSLFAGAHLIPAYFLRHENSPGIWRKFSSEWRATLGDFLILQIQRGGGEREIHIQSYTFRYKNIRLSMQLIST